MRIAPLASHLGRFKEAIYAVEGHNLDCTNVGNLLQYASGIREIDYSAASEAGMYCSGIADYERQEEQAVGPFLHGQSVFLLAWMALESLIDGLIPSREMDRGKIRALCAYLKKKRHLIDIPYGYSELVREWCVLEKAFDSSYSPRMQIPTDMDETGEGVFRVYCLRNHVFHGDFSGFDPADERWATYTHAMALGTRLTALTIQMGLMLRFHQASFMETYWHWKVFEGEDQISVKEGFAKLHLEASQAPSVSNALDDAGTHE